MIVLQQGARAIADSPGVGHLFTLRFLDELCIAARAWIGAPFEDRR